MRWAGDRSALHGGAGQKEKQAGTANIFIFTADTTFNDRKLLFSTKFLKPLLKHFLELLMDIGMAIPQFCV